MVTNPMPGSCSSRATSSASSARICSPTRSGLEPWAIGRAGRLKSEVRSTSQTFEVGSTKSDERRLRISLRDREHAFHREHFDHIADFEVVEFLEADAALESRFHLAHI